MSPVLTNFKTAFKMVLNQLRIGNFTSSEIVALTKKDRSGKGWGAPALTYISETNMERRLGRSLTDESNARPLMWGKLVEGLVFDLLGMEYSLTSSDTESHPTVPGWAGSKDGCKRDPLTGIVTAIMDIKSPMTLKSFCNLVDPVYEGLTGLSAISAIRDRHKDGDKFYWQLVSNACISNAQYAELVVYMPYQSELEAIRTKAVLMADPSYYWLANSTDEYLPYIVEGGYYNNLNVIRFEVPQADKDELTRLVVEASKELIQWPESKNILPS